MYVGAAQGGYSCATSKQLNDATITTLELLMIAPGKRKLQAVIKRSVALTRSLACTDRSGTARLSDAAYYRIYFVRDCRGSLTKGRLLAEHHLPPHLLTCRVVYAICRQSLHGRLSLASLSCLVGEPQFIDKRSMPTVCFCAVRPRSRE